MEVAQNSFAVLPYLKTSSPVRLGGLLFRSTDDLDGLGEADARAVSEIASMLFLQNSIRIKSGSYATLARLPDYLENESPSLAPVKAMRAVLAYCYAAPHPEFGSTFLPLESSDLLTFTPDRVTDFLVWPEHHTVDVEPTKLSPPVGSPELFMRDGYRGYRNFHLPFWVTVGCRIYPSAPTLGLNISQDLSCDVSQFKVSDMYGGLFDLMEGSPSDFRSRILTAVVWFNRTNSMATDEPTAIVQLAIAFEALLSLPQSDKTDRFVDAISLLLGRVPRLDMWSAQFYKLRSQIAHEGEAAHTRYVVPSQRGRNSEDSLYHSILVFGRQIFQACLSAILFGERLARRTDVGTKLFTNAERFVYVCQLLSDKTLPPVDRLRLAQSTILDINKYRYVSETGLDIDRLVGAVRLASRCLLDCGESLVMFRADDLNDAARAGDDDLVLDALQRLQECRRVRHADTPSNPESISDGLFDVVWHYTFQHYFWRKRERERKAQTELIGS